jgi:hypothetical protein
MQRFLDLFILFNLLYMFQAVPPPIIRSTKNVHSALGIVKTILLPAAIVDEICGRQNFASVLETDYRSKINPLNHELNPI